MTAALRLAGATLELDRGIGRVAAVEHIRIEVHVAGPDDGPELLIDGNLLES